MAYVGLAGCERMARNLMDVHGLASWEFRWSVARFTAGSCNLRTRVIRLSRPMAERLGPEGMRDTVLHEIAHALAGPGHGHDATWKGMCRRIGAVPEACYRPGDDESLTPARYTGTCPGGHQHRRQVLTAKAFRETCGRCAPRFDLRYQITWEANPDYDG